MDHARVTSALVARGTRFLLEHRDLNALPGQVSCGARSDRAGPDHQYVDGLAQLRWPFSRR